MGLLPPAYVAECVLRGRRPPRPRGRLRAWQARGELGRRRGAARTRHFARRAQNTQKIGFSNKINEKSGTNDERCTRRALRIFACSENGSRGTNAVPRHAWL